MDVPLGGFIDMPAHSVGQIPPKTPMLGGVNRRFPAKLVKSKNMHFIKSTTSGVKFSGSWWELKLPHVSLELLHLRAGSHTPVPGSHTLLAGSHTSSCNFV